MEDFGIWGGMFVSFLFLVAVVAGGWLYKNPSRDSALLFGFTLLLFSILYSVVVLHLEVTGFGYSVKRIEATRKEIEEIAEKTILSAYVVADGVARGGGFFPGEYREQLEKYAKELDHLLKKEDKEDGGIIQKVKEMRKE